MTLQGKLLSSWNRTTCKPRGLVGHYKKMDKMDNSKNNIYNYYTKWKIHKIIGYL